MLLVNQLLYGSAKFISCTFVIVFNFWNVQFADSLRRGSLSAPELCDFCLKRLNKTRELNAFITPLPESAIRSAEAAQQRILQGFYHLVVLDNFKSIKDRLHAVLMLMMTTGFPCILESHVNFLPHFSQREELL